MIAKYFVKFYIIIFMITQLKQCIIYNRNKTENCYDWLKQLSSNTFRNREGLETRPNGAGRANRRMPHLTTIAFTWTVMWDKRIILRIMANKPIFILYDAWLWLSKTNHVGRFRMNKNYNLSQIRIAALGLRGWAVLTAFVGPNLSGGQINQYGPSSAHLRGWPKSVIARVMKWLKITID